MRLLEWIMARLAGRQATALVLGVALLLTLPSLASSFFIDEYVQAIHWRTGLGPFIDRCYVFVTDDATGRREMLDELGVWWAAPSIRVAFWRPLSAATHALDLALWPASAALMHVHTLLWFMALLLVTGALYKRLLTPRIAVLALALYAWDDARGHVLSWIAKRNAIIAALFGIFTLIAYDRWRRDGWRPGAWLGPALFAASLFAADMGLATAAYLVAYALVLDRGDLPRRLVRLLPYALLVIGWQAAYRTSGHGVYAPGFGYVHPLEQPFAFGAQLLESAPILALGQLTPVAADFWGMLPHVAKIVVWALAVLVLGLLARGAWPRVGARPEARFWLLGAGLSLVPAAASGPSDTNLVFVGFGAAAVLAMVFASVVDAAPPRPGPRFAFGALAVFNLALAPLVLPAKCLTTLGIARLGAAADTSLSREPAVAQQTLVVVSAIMDGHLAYVRKRRDAEGVPQPSRMRILVNSADELSVTRSDERTLRLEKPRGFFPETVQRMYLDPDRPLRQGDVVELSDVSVTVAELLDDGRPRTVLFRFAEPLESPHWLWMRGEGLALVGWIPPKVGETVTLGSPP